MNRGLPAEATNEPQGQLPSYLQGRESGSVIVLVLVGGCIANPPKMMKKVGRSSRYIPRAGYSARSSMKGSSVEVNRPARAAISCANNSANCRSLKRQVFGSVEK